MNFVNNSDSDLYVEGWVTCMYGLDSAKLIKVKAGESQLIPKSNTDCWTIYDSKYERVADLFGKPSTYKQCYYIINDVDYLCKYSISHEIELITFIFNK